MQRTLLTLILILSLFTTVACDTTGTTQRVNDNDDQVAESVASELATSFGKAFKTQYCIATKGIQPLHPYSFINFVTAPNHHMWLLPAALHSVKYGYHKAHC